LEGETRGVFSQLKDYKHIKEVLEMKNLCIAGIFLFFISRADAGMKLLMNDSIAPDAIYLTPTETITLGIVVEDGAEFLGGDIGVALSNSQGSLDHSSIVFETMPMTRYLNPGWVIAPREWDSPYSVYESSSTEVKMTGSNLTWNTIGPYTLMDDLVYQQDEYTDVIIDLVAIGDLVYMTYAGDPPSPDGFVPIYTKGQIIDQLHITAIPEPATFVLLGLGAVALIKKR
jgi:hypothetical protein